jgi:transcriptional regulator with XRE-family HTH domain
MLEGLRRLRLAAGLSHARLARAVGVPVDTVRKWETGQRRPTITSLVRLARALGVTRPELLSRAPQAPLEHLQQQFRRLFHEVFAAPLSEQEKVVLSEEIDALNRHLRAMPPPGQGE